VLNLAALAHAPAAITKDEYEVISAIVSLGQMHVRGDGTLAVVRRQTMHRTWDICNEVLTKKELDKSLLADFSSRNRLPSVFAENGFDAKRVTLLSSSEERRLFPDGLEPSVGDSAKWIEFRRAKANSYCVETFSRVGFARDRRTALALQDYYCDWNEGHILYLAYRTAQGWKIEDQPACSSWGHVYRFPNPKNQSK
jgi:hypothetical protein